MGFFEGGVCYASYDQAVSAKFAGQVFEVHATAGDKVHLYEFVNGAWYLSEYLTNTGSWILGYQVPVGVVGFPSCVVDITPFDPATFAAFWSVAMTFTLGVYLLAKNAGIILQMIRRW